MGINEFFQDDQNLLGLAQILAGLNPDKRRAAILSNIAGQQLNFARQQAQQKSKKEEDEARSQSLMELLFRSQGQPPEAIGPPQMTPGPMSELIPPEMDAGTQPMPQMEFMSQLAGIPGFEGIAAQSALKQMTAPAANPLGKVNPKDFTPESVQAFAQTGDFNTLVPQERITSKVTTNVNTDSDFKVPAGFKRDPNNPGAVVPIPGGPQAALQKASEAQLVSAGYANRIRAANEIFDTLEAKAFDATSVLDATAESIPFLGNMLIDEDRQVLNQAKRDFVTAVLRKESGATIQDSEFRREDKKFFPQPGDGKRVIKNKKALRVRQFENMKKASKGAFEKQFGESAANEQPPIDLSTLSMEQLIELRKQTQ